MTHRPSQSVPSLISVPYHQPPADFPGLCSEGTEGKRRERLILEFQNAGSPCRRQRRVGGGIVLRAGREREAQWEGLTKPCPGDQSDPEQQSPHEEVQKSLGWDSEDKPGAAQARLAEVGASTGSPQAVCVCVWPCPGDERGAEPSMTHGGGPAECPEQCINSRVQLSQQGRAPWAAAAQGEKELQGEQEGRSQE